MILKWFAQLAPTTPAYRPAALACHNIGVLLCVCSSANVCHSVHLSVYPSIKPGIWVHASQALRDTVFIFDIHILQDLCSNNEYLWPWNWPLSTSTYRELFLLLALVAQLVECPLRGTGGHEFDIGPWHSKVVKNVAWHSDYTKMVHVLAAPRLALRLTG